MNRFFPTVPAETIPVGRHLTTDDFGVVSTGVGFAPLTGWHLSGTVNMMSAAQTALAMGAGYGYAYPLVVAFDVNVASMHLHVTTAVAGASFELAYFEAGEDGWPTGATVAASGVISGATNGIKTYTLPATQTIRKGRIYWLCVGVGSTGCTGRAYSSGTGRVLRSVGSASNQHNGIRWTHVAGNWRNWTASPLLTTETLNSAIPMMYFTVA